jgi:CubicO group peptidase (beta-lactamase class C family)
MRNATLLALGSLWTATPAAAQRLPRGVLVARIDSLARSAIAEDRSPGLSVAVVHGSDTLVARGYGRADLENDVPVTTASVFRVGSVTKQFTAAAIMQLVEQGRLALDDTLQKFLPDFPAQGHRVTIRHLLDHTSGIKSYTALGQAWRRRMRDDLPHDSLVALFSTLPFDFAPGERFSYNNSGYYLLGMIIERLTGRSYEAWLAENLYPRAGLRSTIYCNTRPLVPRRAQGYERDSSGFVNADFLSMGQPYSAGSLCSTALDLVAWTRALWDGRVVNAESFRQMITPGRLAGGSQTRYGLGLFVAELSGHRRVGHGGGINGFTAALDHYPDDSLTVAVLANSGSWSPNQLSDRIARAALGIPEPMMRDLVLAPAERERYAGAYRLGPLEIRIYERGDSLFAQASGQGAFRLLYQGGHVFLASFDTTVQLSFEMGPASARAFTLFQGGGSQRAERIAGR